MDETFFFLHSLPHFLQLFRSQRHKHCTISCDTIEGRGWILERERGEGIVIGGLMIPMERLEKRKGSLWGRWFVVCCLDVSTGITRWWQIGEREGIKEQIGRGGRMIISRREEKLESAWNEKSPLFPNSSMKKHIEHSTDTQRLHFVHGVETLRNNELESAHIPLVLVLYFTPNFIYGWTLPRPLILSFPSPSFEFPSSNHLNSPFPFPISKQRCSHRAIHPPPLGMMGIRKGRRREEEEEEVEEREE